MMLLQPQNTPIWLGGDDISKEGNWIWHNSGEDVDYSRLNPGEPNGGVSENCLAMWYENGNWADYVCSAPLNFHVCEKTTGKTSASPQIKPRKKIYDIIEVLNDFIFFKLQPRLSRKRQIRPWESWQSFPG